MTLPHSTEEGRNNYDDSHVPLAARMRPISLDEIVGQQHLLAPGRAVRSAIDHDKLTSMILWGPPGSGKTTLAEAIAHTTRSRFSSLSAASSGVSDLRKVVEAAGQLLQFNGERTVLFIDEIHRFNKAQQDAILPHVERGTVTLIGATTENPGFEVISALRSRCRVFRLEKLTDEEVLSLLDRALRDEERGLGRERVQIDSDALSRLSRLADGDARIALTALDMAVAAAPRDENGVAILDASLLEDVMQRPSLLFDKSGDFHYHLISAYIKSVRGSDPDASVYWLARMLEAGEDPVFVARRALILASEDVGLADPLALVVANACFQAVHSIGMPEAFLPLTECTLYLALAPKSNSAITSYTNARQDVEHSLNEPVPLHLRNAATSFDRSQGYGRDYQYAHNFPGHTVDQQYLPTELVGKKYYSPSGQGAESPLAVEPAQRHREPA